MDATLKKDPNRIYRINQLFVNLWSLPICQELRYCQLWENLKQYVKEKGYYESDDWFYVEDNKIEAWIKEYYNYLSDRKSL